MKIQIWRLFVFLMLMVFVTACGGSDGPEAQPQAEATATKVVVDTPTDTPEPVDTPTPTPLPLKATSLDEAQNAIIQIVAQGTFVDPAEGLQLNAAGSGSGFIIDESGIAVTNNHVVTGAALLQVYVAGSNEPVNARILGVSECSDLAVIDIEGDGFHYMDWYEGDIKPGLDVYAAGFPLGDPEFTLTRGIVSKAKANGETSWASVDAVIEHDSTINPGNSGGPLITQDGAIVGVNYAGASEVGQFFAIAQEEALPVIEILQGGEDVTSIGVNGTAVNTGEGLSGIWVSSVKSGSPADKVGIEAGDIITSIEGLVLATDGTMSDYCDILRTHDSDDVMSVEVLRFATEEVLEGQLNGDKLAQSFSFAQALGDEVGNGGEGETGGSETTLYDYTTLTDNVQAIQVEVPVQWSETNGSTWLFQEEEVGAAFSAAPNIDDFLNTFDTPGVFFGASSVLAQRYTVDEMLDYLKSDICTYGGRTEYSDELYTGAYDLYSDCGDNQSVIIDLVAEPADQSFLLWVDVQVVSDADLDALDRILKSFQVIGELPHGGAVDSSSGDTSGSSETSEGDGPVLLPTATPEPPPSPPTATPAPSTNEFAPNPGQSRLYLVNEYPEEVNFTIDNQAHKIATGTEYSIDLAPGKYTFSLDIPSSSVNGEVEVGPDQTWAIFLDEHGSLYEAQQIYP